MSAAEYRFRLLPKGAAREILEARGKLKRLARAARREPGREAQALLGCVESLRRALAGALLYAFARAPGAEGLWRGCLAYARARGEAAEAAVAAAFSGRPLSFAAAGALPALLSAAAAVAAAEGYAPNAAAPGVAAWAAGAVEAFWRLDTDRLAAALCPAEALLLRDPAGLYPKLSAEEKALYRRRLTRLCRFSGRDEASAAAAVLSAAEKAEGERRHIGCWLPEPPKRWGLAGRVSAFLRRAGPPLTPGGGGDAEPRQKKQPDRAVAVCADGESAWFSDRDGGGRFLFDGCDLLRFSGRVRGVFTAAGTGDGVLPVPAPGGDAPKAWGSESAVDSGALKLRRRILFIPHYGALAVRLEARNVGLRPLAPTLLWYLEPALSPLPSGGADAQPLGAAYKAEHGALVFYREGGPALALGFQDGGDLLFTCSSAAAGRDPASPCPFADGVPDFDCDPLSLGASAALGRGLRLAPGAWGEKTLLLAPAADEAGALQKLSLLRRCRLSPRAADPLPREPVLRAAAERLLAQAFLASPLPDAPAGSPPGQKPPGSGALPVLSVEAQAVGPRVALGALRLHGLLTAMGAANDLVFAAPGPERTRLKRTAARMGFALEEPGGVYFTERFAGEAAFSAGAAIPADPHPPPRPPAPPGALRALPLVPLGGALPDGYRVSAETGVWPHALAVPGFGTLLTNASLGFTWAFGVGENLLSSSEPAAGGHYDGERLFMRAGGRLWDVIAGASAAFTRGAARYEALCGDTRVRVTVTLEPEAPRKQMRAAWYGGRRRPEFIFSLRPAPRAAGLFSGPFAVSPTENGLLLRSPYEEGGAALLTCSRPARAERRGDAFTLTATGEGTAGEITFSLGPAGRRQEPPR